jgi:phosphoglycolate phosphatase-like HAD superfamily hydrolase
VRRLILFDIDGTLLSTDGHAGQAIARAISDTLGTAVTLTGYSYAGKTDPFIVHELAARAGLARAAVAPHMDEIFTRYCTYLHDTLSEKNTRPLPGVHELLAALAERRDATLALLTGNIRTGAEIKLELAGLARHFQFGAFGSDAEDRNHLVQVARERAKAHTGMEFPGARTVVVGDAVADIRCARFGAARAVAVASGVTPRHELMALAPDALLESLRPAEALPALFDDDRAGTT